MEVLPPCTVTSPWSCDLAARFAARLVSVWQFGELWGLVRDAACPVKHKHFGGSEALGFPQLNHRANAQGSRPRDLLTHWACDPRATPRGVATMHCRFASPLQVVAKGQLSWLEAPCHWASLGLHHACRMPLGTQASRRHLGPPIVRPLHHRPTDSLGL